MCVSVFGCVVLLNSDNVLGSLAVAYFRAHALIASVLAVVVVDLI